MTDTRNGEDSGKLLYCSFCGKSQHEVRKLIAGPSVFICDECVDLCNDIIREEVQEAQAESSAHKLPAPKEISSILDQYVIGQERAKKVLSVAVYNHYKRLNQRDKKDDVELGKSNILLIGPTGTGKTLLAQTLAKVLQVPFSMADATILTEAGYVGEDVENILVGLLQAADYDVSKAEKGILYLDEVDKIARKNATPAVSRDVSGEGVQQALLKIIEGTVANMPPKGGRKHPEQPMIQMNTRNILFICGGAFEGLEKTISQRVGRRTMGFGAKVAADEPDEESMLAEAQPEDLLAYGLIPEFVGRMPVLTTMDTLGRDDLFRILTQPKNAIVKQVQRLFELDGVELTFTDEALHKVVELTVSKGTGARGLRSVLEQSMMDIMYDIPSEEGARELVVTDAMIKTGAEDDDSDNEDALLRKRA